MGAPAASSTPFGSSPISSGREKFASSTPVLSVTVALISVLPYLPALKFGFVYDDDVQILQNPLLQSWRSLGEIFSQQSWSFLYSGAHGGYYRPVFLAWLNLNHHLFGLRPEGWHFTSLFLHGIVSGLFFLLLRRNGFVPWIAFVAALLFGLHPVHVESVAWISGAPDLLAAAALLVSLLLWWKSTEGTPRSRWMLFLSLASYAVALLSKETAIVFPAIIFTYAHFHARRGVPNADNEAGQRVLGLRRALPFAVVAILYLALRRIVLSGSAATLTAAGLQTTVATAPSLLLFYIRHLVWPTSLSPFYDFFPNTSFSSASLLLRFLVLIVLAGAAAWLTPRSLRGSVVPAFSWLLFPLVPVLWVPFFVGGDQAHDRYLYLPCFGLALLAAELLRRAAAERPQIRAGLKTLAAVILLLLAGSTAVQSRPWRSDLSLYAHACSASPDHPIGCSNLAVALIGQGEYSRAREILRPMLSSKSNASRINGNFGIASYRLADYAAAEGALRRATDLDPTYADAHLYLGLTCYRTSRLQEAETLLRRALGLDPAGEGYHVALGSVLMAQNKFREACEEFRAELQRRPGLPAALSLLRDCEQRLGQPN